MPRRARSAGALLAATLGCGGPAEPQVTVEVTPEPVAVTDERLQPTRRCGQSGPSPTARPLDLAGCPAFALLQQTGAEQSMWLSTVGIRRHAFEEDGSGFGIELSEVEPGEWALDISDGAYRLREPAPKRGRLRVLEHEVSIDEVQTTNGLGVLASVRRAPPVEPISDRVSADGCGEGSPRPTTIPRQLRKPAPVVGDFHMVEGDEFTNGPLDIFYAFGFIRARPRDTAIDWTAAEAGYSTTVIRIGHDLLRIDPSEGDEVHVRRLRTRCPQQHTVAATDGPRYVWLSTIGFGEISFGNAKIQLVPHTNAPQLRGMLEAPIYQRRLQPETAGDAFTLDGWLVEVLEVELSGDAMYLDELWLAGSTFPRIHVQLRLTPPGPEAT